jgi:hypothetical protein
VPVVRVYGRRLCFVRRICATIRCCGTVAPKLDFSGSTRNNRVRAEKCTLPWSERRLGLAAATRLSTSALFGVQFHSAFDECFVNTNRNYRSVDNALCTYRRDCALRFTKN